MRMETISDVARIWVLIGLPGSGKSTWVAKMTALHPEYVVVSSDDFIEAKAAEEGKTYSEVFDKYIGAATGAMKQAFRDALVSGKSIIWDQTNMTKKKRRGILSQIPKYYFKVAVDFDVDDRELARRLANRAEASGKVIPDHIIKSMGKSYEAPTKDEGFDQIIKIKG